MTSLTSYLAGRKLTDQACHAAFPWLPTTAEIVPDSECGGCSYRTTAGHETCLGIRIRRGSVPDTDHRLRLSTLRALQWLVHRLNLDRNGIIGSEPGLLIGAKASYNYADATTWEIVSVSGDEVTLKHASNPRMIQLYAFRSREPEFGLGYITGGGAWGVLQPGDVIKFSAPSVLADKAEPTVKQIISCDAEALTVTVLLDQDVHHAKESGDTSNPSPSAYYCASWRQAGDPEKWLPIVPPAPLTGIQRTVIFTQAQTTADIYDFGDVLIAPPITARATMRVTGFAGTLTTDITAGVATRFEIVHNANGTSSKFYSGTVGPNGGSFASSLWDTYDRIKIEYVQYQSGLTAGVAPCHRRCAWARPDYSNSVCAYSSWGTGDGDGSGVQWYCARRMYPVQTAVDTNSDGIDDEYQYSWQNASGFRDFPADGQCMQYGLCDQFLALDDVEAAWQAFSQRTHAGWFFQDLWCSVDTVLEQLLAGYAGLGNLWFYREQHASLTSLVGGYGLETPVGMHPRKQVLNWGGYGRKAVDESGDDHSLYVRSGAAWDTTSAPTTYEIGDWTTYPARGHYPAEVTSFVTQHSAIDYDVPVDEYSEAGIDRCRHIERCGLALKRDGGEQTGRGLARYSHAHTEDLVVVVPGVVPASYGAQVRGGATFERLSSPQTVLGVSCGAAITLRTIRQAAKSETVKYSREIYSATDLGSNLVQIDLENTSHTWSEIGGTPGDRHDVLHEFYGGGGDGFRPEDPGVVNSYYETDKAFGAVARGVQPGDTAQITYTHSGTNLSTRRYLVVSATPHGGSAASTWGDGYETAIGQLGGAVSATTTNLRLAIDSTYGDPDDSYYTHGTVYAPELTVSTGITSGDTSVVVTPQVSIAAGVVLKCDRTGEAVKVSSVSYGGNDITLGITRGISGTPAALNAGDILTWQLVTRHSDDVPATRSTATFRPWSLTSGYWLDATTNKLIPSTALAGYTGDWRYVVWPYTGEQGPVGTDHAYTQAMSAFPAYAEWVAPIDYSTYGDPSHHPRTIEYVDADDITANGGATITEVYVDPTSSGTARITSSGSSFLVRMRLDEAGRRIRLRVATDTTAAAPPDSVALCGRYTSYGKKRDRCVLYDPSGALSAAASGLAGSTIAFVWSAGVIGQTKPQVSYAAFQSDTWTAVADADVVEENGTIWLSETARAALPDKCCLRVD